MKRVSVLCIIVFSVILDFSGLGWGIKSFLIISARMLQ